MKKQLQIAKQVGKWAFKRSLVLLIVVPAVLISFLIFLLYTSPGLYFSIASLNFFTKYQITLANAEGSTFSHIQAKQLTISDKDQQIVLKDLDLHLDLEGVFHQKLESNATFSEAAFSKKQAPLVIVTQGKLKAWGALNPLSIQGQFNGDYRNAPIQIIGNTKPEQLKVEAKLQNNTVHLQKDTFSNWDIQASIPSPAVVHPLLASFKNGISAEGHLINLNEGEFIVHIKPGSLELKNKEVLHFEWGRFVCVS